MVYQGLFTCKDPLANAFDCEGTTGFVLPTGHDTVGRAGKAILDQLASYSSNGSKGFVVDTEKIMVHNPTLRPGDLERPFGQLALNMIYGPRFTAPPDVMAVAFKMEDCPVSVVLIFVRSEAQVMDPQGNLRAKDSAAADVTPEAFTKVSTAILDAARKHYVERLHVPLIRMYYGRVLAGQELNRAKAVTMDARRTKAEAEAEQAMLRRGFKALAAQKQAEIARNFVGGFATAFARLEYGYFCHAFIGGFDAEEHRGLHEHADKSWQASEAVRKATSPGGGYKRLIRR